MRQNSQSRKPLKINESHYTCPLLSYVMAFPLDWFRLDFDDQQQPPRRASPRAPLLLGKENPTEPRRT